MERFVAHRRVLPTPPSAHTIPYAYLQIHPARHATGRVARAVGREATKHDGVGSQCYVEDGQHNEGSNDIDHVNDACSNLKFERGVAE